jgi:hypothetical protein
MTFGSIGGRVATLTMNTFPAPEKDGMAPAEQVEVTRQELDAIAWRFLGSEFTAQIYANWSIDRRVDAYLLHHGLVDFVNDGTAYSALLERVMVNIAHAIRLGLLAPSRTR